MRRCAYCGLENDGAAAHCRECLTDFAGVVPSSTPPKEQPFQIRSWQPRLISVLVIGFCLWTKFAAGGWLMFIGFFIYPLIVIAHFLFCSRALPSSGSVAAPLLRLLVTSHAMLIVGFLLQADFGDSRGWLSFMVLLGREPGSPAAQPPDWWPGLLMNVLGFIPVGMTWVALKRQRRSPRPGSR